MSELYVFHGIDNKVGTTMISQSVAEILADAFPGKQVAFMALNGRVSMEYVREGAEPIDNLKSRLESRMLAEDELAAHCRRAKNLSILGGVCNEDDERYYHPDMAAYLIEVADKSFDIVVIDSGNRLDNGLAFGALSSVADRFFIMTQQETMLARWEKRKSVYERLDIMPKAYILNNYMEKDVYPLEYIAKRLGADRGKFHKVSLSHGGREAEIERKTLWVSSNSPFSADMIRFTESIIRVAPGQLSKQKRKKLWRSFI
jgi:hypothetical protein